MRTITIPSRLDVYGTDLGHPLVHYMGFDSRRDTSLKLHEHTHDGYEITYVFEGAVVWEMGDGRKLRLSGGDMALIQPRLTHKGHLDIIQPAAIFWLATQQLSGAILRNSGFEHVECARLDSVLSTAGNNVWYAGETFHESLCMLHDQMRRWQTHRGDVGGAPVVPGIRGLINHVLVLAAGVAQQKRSPRSVGNYVNAARLYMRSHLDSDVKIADVARHVGISMSRLHALFKKETGLTPNDFLQRLRIEKAETLLCATNTPVTRIALDLGFSSSQYFATCFRKYTGMAPAEFRAKYGTE